MCTLATRKRDPPVRTPKSNYLERFLAVGWVGGRTPERSGGTRQTYPDSDGGGRLPVSNLKDRTLPTPPRTLCESIPRGRTDIRVPGNPSDTGGTTE